MSAEPRNDVRVIAQAIVREAHENEIDLKAAARIVKGRYPDLCRHVMEKIGHWPSSEPELAALQAVYPDH